MGGLALLIFLIAILKLRSTLAAVNSMQLRTFFIILHFVFVFLYVASIALFLYFTYIEVDKLEDKDVDICTKIYDADDLKIRKEYEKIYLTDPIELILNLFVLFLVQNFAREIKIH